jgi:hypothetical protein
MTIASEITRIKTNIANAYAKAEEKGATIPEVKNSENLVACIESVSSGGSDYSGIPSYQIVDGVITKNSIENFIHDNVITIGENGLDAYFNGCNVVGTVSFANLVTVEKYGLREAFYNCVGITSVNFDSLVTVGQGGLNYAFYKCALTELDLKSLTTINSSGLSNAFYANKNLTVVNVNSLATVGASGLSGTFTGCTSLTTISFPALTSVQPNSFTNAFSACTGLKEIHFRADMQGTIEGLTGYSAKFGATNATIYFDL